MEKQTFKFTTEELRKINIHLPKGYKFVTKEEIVKRQTHKVGVPRKRATLPPPLPPIHLQQSISPPPPAPKVKVQKQEEYQPQKKIVTVAPIQIPIDPVPAGTGPNLLERIKKHPAFTHLLLLVKVNQSDISLKQIEEKAKSQGEGYRVIDLENDITSFFHMVYRCSVKTSSDYRMASQVENYLYNLMKVQVGDRKKQETRGGQGGRKKAVPVRTYQPLSSYKTATPFQKRQLGMMIRKLPSENLQQIIYIMFESSEVKEYTFDLDNIHIKKFRELEDYVKKCMEKIGDWDPRMLDDEEFSNQSQFIIDDEDQ